LEPLPDFSFSKTSFYAPTGSMSIPCGSYLAAWLPGEIQTFIGVLIALIAAAQQ